MAMWEAFSNRRRRPSSSPPSSCARSRLQPPSLEFLTPSSRADSLGRLGHYEILEVVGSGGMGIVLKAFDEQLHRIVAIKAMTATLAASATGRQRFVREAQAAAAVNHDNVVDIYAVEETGPVPYLVMEYVAGISLEDKLEQQGPLELKEILRIGLQTADGLAAAHRQGLVHRDVKPANILLENGVGRVKITDFGLARAVDDVSVTQTGVIAGTPAYMSPEQARGEAVDHRSDLFSLGSVLYALCCRPGAVSRQHVAGRAQAGLRGAAAPDPRPQSRHPRVAVCDRRAAARQAARRAVPVGGGSWPRCWAATWPTCSSPRCPCRRRLSRLPRRKSRTRPMPLANRATIAAAGWLRQSPRWSSSA